MTNHEPHIQDHETVSEAERADIIGALTNRDSQLAALIQQLEALRHDMSSEELLTDANAQLQTELSVATAAKDAVTTQLSIARTDKKFNTDDAKKALKTAVNALRSGGDQMVTIAEEENECIALTGAKRGKIEAQHQAEKAEQKRAAAKEKTKEVRPKATMHDAAHAKPDKPKSLLAEKPKHMLPDAQKHPIKHAAAAAAAAVGDGLHSAKVAFIDTPVHAVKAVGRKIGGAFNHGVQAVKDAADAVLHPHMPNLPKPMLATLPLTGTVKALVKSIPDLPQLPSIHVGSLSDLALPSVPHLALDEWELNPFH